MFDRTSIIPVLLERDLYTFVNYEEVAETAHRRGCFMKESKEFYGTRLLGTLEELLKGKTWEEISEIASEIIRLAQA